MKIYEKIFGRTFKETEEEININELVNNISVINKKIHDLHKNMEFNKKNDLFKKLYNIEEEISNKKNEINNNMKKEKNKEMKLKKMNSVNELKNQVIEMDLEELNEKLKDITSDNKNTYKEIYSVSNEKIKSILLERLNEDKLKYLNIDYNNLIIIYQNILNDIKSFTNKKEQILEKMKMIEEEKQTLEVKIIENISQKESFEEMAKINLFQFLNQIKIIDNQNENNKSQNIINSDIQQTYILNIPEEALIIHFYEINNIEIDSLCKEVTYQIVLAFNACIKNNSNINYLSNNENEENKIKDINENNSFIFEMSSKIKKEILLFLNSFQNYKDEEKYVLNFQILLNEFIIKLSKIIVNLLEFHFGLIKQVTNISSLLIYLKLMFKKFFFERIIRNDSDFVNNEYNKIEKTLKRDLNECIQNLKVLDDKEKIYKSKLDKTEKEYNNLNATLKKDNISGPLKEKTYFNLTKKTNKLIESKNFLNNEFKMKTNNFEDAKETIKNEILNKEKEINNLENQKRIIEEKIVKRNKIILLEIKKLKKLMSEKFNEIKHQLDIYKQKYGSNIHLYDKYMEKINQTILSTSKSLISKNNNHSINNNTVYVTPKNKANFTIFKQGNYINNIKNSAIERRHYSRDYIQNYNNKNSNFINNKKNLTSFHKSIDKIFSRNVYNDMINKKEEKPHNKRKTQENKIKKSKTLNKITKHNYNELNFDRIINDKYLEFKEKYIKLTNPYKCYLREYPSNNKIIFDPLCHSNIIKKEPFKFKSGYLKFLFDANDIYFIFESEDNGISMEIESKDIQATIINNNIKYIIKIHQRFKHRIENEKNFDVNKFIFSNALEDIPLDLNKKLLAIKNKYFNFSVIINHKDEFNKRFEFILEDYENIKIWINALNNLIKSKSK